MYMYPCFWAVIALTCTILCTDPNSKLFCIICIIIMYTVCTMYIVYTHNTTQQSIKWPTSNNEHVHHIARCLAIFHTASFQENTPMAIPQDMYMIFTAVGTSHTHRIHVHVHVHTTCMYMYMYPWLRTPNYQSSVKSQVHFVYTVQHQDINFCL